MKNLHAAALGRLGGLAKARKMSRKDREAQAQRAAYARSIKARIFRDRAFMAMQRDQFDE